MHQPMTPHDEALCYWQLLQLTGWTRLQLARDLGVSPSRICKLLALLEDSERGEDGKPRRGR